MRRTPLALALPVVALALLLGACTTGGGAAAPEDSMSASPEQPSSDAPATDGSSWAADPACADYVAQRSAAMQEGFDQTAEVAGIDDLPFGFATDEYGWMGDQVACVWKVFVSGRTEAAAFELLIYAPEGDASYVVTTSPDLTVRDCPTDNPVVCLEDSSGHVVIVTPVGSLTGTEGFAASVQGVGVQ